MTSDFRSKAEICR